MADHTITESPESRAESFGMHTAETEIMFGAGVGHDAPLSGEWADSLSERDLFILVMHYDVIDEDDLVLMERLADSFEAGYHARWGALDDA